MPDNVVPAGGGDGDVVSLDYKELGSIAKLSKFTAPTTLQIAEKSEKMGP